MKGSVSIRLTEAVNDMGNALTAATWPIKAVHYPNGVKIYDTKEVFKELVTISMDVENQQSDLKDCVNELCLKCGNYREAHLGACDSCRWKAVKEAV